MKRNPSSLLALLQAEASLGGIGAAFLTAAGQIYSERAIRHPYPKGDCYRTAFLLSQKHPELTYCEGRALTNGIVPIEHAWCIDAGGMVVDTVWEEYLTDYLGVAFNRGQCNTCVTRCREPSDS